METEFQRFDLVMHKRTCMFYKIDRFLKVRMGHEWVAGVGYFSLDDYDSYYVRTLDGFMEAFEHVRGKG